MASPVAVCGVPATTTSELDAVYHQQAYDAEHIAENSNSSRLVAVASAGTLADAVVGSGECVGEHMVFSYSKFCGDEMVMGTAMVAAVVILMLAVFDVFDVSTVCFAALVIAAATSTSLMLH